MRKAFYALAVLAFLLGLSSPAPASDTERMLQGGYGGYKYQAKERLKINYNNDFTQTAYFFDHNRSMPEGNPFCYGMHFVKMGSARHFTRSRVDGFALTLEQSFELKRVNLRYELLDPDEIVPGFNFLFPDFDMDVYGWNQFATWDRTGDGTTFPQIYQQTQGVNVLFVNNFLNRGRETPGDFVLGGCWSFLGHDSGRTPEQFRSVLGGWITSVAEERRRLRQESGHPERE